MFNLAMLPASDWQAALSHRNITFDGEARLGGTATDGGIKGQDRRDALLDAAERCFVESGFHGARMAQIAREAGTSPGLIYHYFDSKEAVIAELIARYLRRKTARLHEIEEAGGPVVEAFIGGMDENLEQALDPFWSALTLEVTAEATRNDEVAAIIRQADRETRDALCAALGGASPSDDLRARVEVFLSLVQGLGLRTVRNPGLEREAVIALVRSMTRTLLAPTRTEGAD